MIEIVAILTLFILLIGFLIYHVITIRDMQSYQKTLVKALMAKDLPELDASERIEKLSDKEEDKNEFEVVDEFVPLGDADEETFNKFIEDQLKAEDNG